MTAAASLQLDDLGCRRGERMLFEGLSLTASAGRLLRVQGANGAGKTSLLRMICGLLPPTRGSVRWQGQRVSALREEFGRQLVYLGHAAALKPELSALENLRVATRLQGLTASPAALQNALRQAGLAEHMQLPTHALSQGQRRRAALARLPLAATAPLWVLDEPFNALDQTAAAWLGELLQAQLARGGIVVLTSHQPVALPHPVSQITVTL